MKRAAKILSCLALIVSTFIGGYKFVAHVKLAAYNDGLQYGFQVGAEAGVRCVLEDAATRGFGEWFPIRMPDGSTIVKFRWYSIQEAGENAPTESPHDPAA